MATAELRQVFLASVTEFLRTKYGLAVTSQRQLDGFVDVNVWVEVYDDITNPHIHLRHPDGYVVKLINEQDSQRPSLLDVNVWVDVYDDITNPHIHLRHPDGYVVKLINEQDSQRPSLLDARQRLMMHVNEGGIPTPLPVKAITGCYASSIELVTECDVTKRQIVVMTFVRGSVLSNIPMTKDVLYDLGRITGNLNLCMKTFSDVACLEYDSLWKVCEIGNLLRMVELAPSENIQTMSLNIIKEFNSKVFPNLQKYQTGLIHHDVGPQNIVMRQDINQKWKVAAILDFGDVCSSCYVFEVAILLSNIFMNTFSRSMTPSEVTLTRDMVFDSYTEVVPLSTGEKEVIDICVKARILQCCLHAENTRKIDRGNEYIRNYICWELLEELTITSRD